MQVFLLAHSYNEIVRKNEAKEEFSSVEELRNNQRQHLGYATSRASAKPSVILSAVISRKDLMKKKFMNAKIVATVLNPDDFFKDPNNNKCPKFRDLRSQVMADSSKPYKAMMDDLSRTREPALGLKRRHSRVDEDDNDIHILSDIRAGGKRCISVSSTKFSYPSPPPCYKPSNGPFVCN